MQTLFAYQKPKQLKMLRWRGMKSSPRWTWKQHPSRPALNDGCDWILAEGVLNVSEIAKASDRLIGTFRCWRLRNQTWKIVVTPWWTRYYSSLVAWSYTAAQSVEWLHRIPVVSIKQHGWIPWRSRTHQTIRVSMENLLLTLAVLLWLMQYIIPTEKKFKTLKKQSGNFVVVARFRC